MSDAEEWQNIGGWYDRLTHWRYGHGIVPANYCAGSHEFSVDVGFALREIAALRARAERAEAEVVKAIGYLTRNCLAPRKAKPHDDLMGICTQVDHLLSTARAEALRETVEKVNALKADLHNIDELCGVEHALNRITALSKKEKPDA